MLFHSDCDRAVVVQVAGFHRHVGHARVEIHGAHRVADRLVLLDDGQVALVVLVAVAAAVQEELGQLDVLPPLARAFPLVHEPRQPHQRLFESLVAVVPGLFGGRADVAVPAIGQASRGVVQPRVLAAGHQVVGHRRLDEVAGAVAFVIRLARPAPLAAERVARVQIAVGLLGREDLGNPIVDRLLHVGLGGDDFRVALRIDHHCQAHRLQRVVDLGVRPRRTDVFRVGSPGQLVAGLDEVFDAAFGQSGLLSLADAMRDPMDDLALDALAPEGAGQRVPGRLDEIQVRRRWRRRRP